MLQLNTLCLCLVQGSRRTLLKSKPSHEQSSARWKTCMYPEQPDVTAIAEFSQLYCIIMIM